MKFSLLLFTDDPVWKLMQGKDAAKVQWPFVTEVEPSRFRRSKGG